MPVNEYTIEYIMPQTENLSASWRAALGEEWGRVHETYLHTLGNLTLTGFNSEYSDRPFIEKRNMEGGFCESPLRVNSGLGDLDTWNENEIRDRASRLASRAVSVRAAPVIGSDVVNAYRPQPTKAAGYTIDDHPHLLNGPVRDLFDALRKEIVQLDPCVVEEFLKLYVAYKAEANFVDIVPQAKQLVLSPNIGFSELDDPKGLSKDVSGLGRWGNGDVEVRLCEATDLQYVVGLVRQALEQQLGAGIDG